MTRRGGHRDVGTYPRCWVLERLCEREGNAQWEAIDERDTDELDGCRQLPVHFQISKVDAQRAGARHAVQHLLA